jgi:beta-lactamase class A
MWKAAAVGSILSLGALAAAGPPPPERPAPETSLRERIGTFRGEMGLFARNLETGQSFAVNADARFPTASVIKLAVMAEVERRLAEGTLAAGTTVTLREADKVGEGTPLNALHAGTVLTVPDLVRLMIAWSDNTATNLLVRLVGTKSVNALLDAHGLRQTRLYRPTFRDGRADVLPEEEKEFGLGSTTPREAAGLMERIADGRIAGRAASERMIAVLATQQDRAMIPRSLPFSRDAILVANKTGWDEEKRPDARGFRGDVRGDVAYVKGPRGRFVIAILARRIADKDPGVDNDALRTGAELARRVYDAFQGRAGALAR